MDCMACAQKECAKYSVDLNKYLGYRTRTRGIYAQDRDQAHWMYGVGVEMSPARNVLGFCNSNQKRGSPGSATAATSNWIL